MAARALVVPVFNEAPRVGRCVGELSRELDASKWSLVFVDDGSTDQTILLLGDALAASCLRSEVIELGTHRGKGAALRAGMLATDASTVGFVDADLSTPVGEIERCFAIAETGEADVVIATRARPASVIVERQSLARELAGKSFNLWVRGLGLTSMPDTQCGLKVFDGSIARALFEPLVTEGFAFDVEVLARARRLGARIVEVPVEWRHVVPSRVHPLRDGGRMAFDALRIRREMWRLDRRA